MIIWIPDSYFYGVPDADPDFPIMAGLSAIPDTLSKLWEWWRKK